MTATASPASDSRTQSVDMMMMMDTSCTTPPPPLSSMMGGVEDDMMMSNTTTTARLLDGALGDMVAVSTPRSATDGAEEGASWRTVRRMASSYTQEDLNLWWSVDAGYLLIDEEKKKAAAVGVVSVEEGDNDNEEAEEEVSRRLLMAQVTPPSPTVTL